MGNPTFDSKVLDYDYIVYIRRYDLQQTVTKRMKGRDIKKLHEDWWPYGNDDQDGPFAFEVVQEPGARHPLWSDLWKFLIGQV